MERKGDNVAPFLTVAPLRGVVKHARASEVTGEATIQRPFRRVDAKSFDTTMTWPEHCVRRLQQRRLP